MNLVFEGHGLKKVFNRRPIFSDVELRVRAGEVLVVTGKNGSGKSTLVKILARVLTPTAGGLRLTRDGNSVKEDLWPYHVGLCRRIFSFLRSSARGKTWNLHFNFVDW